MVLDWWVLVCPNMASSIVVVVAHPIDAGRQRNGGEKVRQLQSKFFILATSADKTGVNNFI
jgi:hypothetical protein